MHRKSKEIVNILDPQIAAEKCNTEFIIEIENQRAGNQQRCHCAECARFEQHRAALYKHAIPIGIAVRNWGKILLTHNLIREKKLRAI